MKQTSQNFRRRATTTLYFVVLTFLIPSSSRWNNLHLSPAVRLTDLTFSSLVYKDVTTSPQNPTVYLSLNQYESLLLTLSLGTLSTTITSLSSTISQDGGNTTTYGSAYVEQGTALYSWYYLTAIPVGSNLSALTNKECSQVQETYSPANLTLGFAQLLASRLPVPYGSVVIVGNLTCQPYYPTQTRPDNPAVFVLSDLQITTLYTEFAVNAPYVTYKNPSSVNTSLQLNETLAPLGQVTVLYYVQESLQHIVLQGVQTSLSLCFCIDG